MIHNRENFAAGARSHDRRRMFRINRAIANAGWYTVQSVVSRLPVGRLRRQNLYRRERQHDHYARRLKRVVRLMSDRRALLK
jgi:hypothetical protein